MMGDLMMTTVGMTGGSFDYDNKTINVSRLKKNYASYKFLSTSRSSSMIEKTRMRSRIIYTSITCSDGS